MIRASFLTDEWYDEFRMCGEVVTFSHIPSRLTIVKSRLEHRQLSRRARK